jgi:maleate cis-trans isomerase
MIGWRARLGFLLPPGNPTVEPEMIALAPEGVSLHFHRMDAGGGVPGVLDNQDERTRAMIESIDGAAALLAMVRPDIIVVAHTATSYYLGGERETALLARLGAATGTRVVTPSARSRPRCPGSACGGSRSAPLIRRKPRRRAGRIWRRTVSTSCGPTT